MRRDIHFTLYKNKYPGLNGWGLISKCIYYSVLPEWIRSVTSWLDNYSIRALPMWGNFLALVSLCIDRCVCVCACKIWADVCVHKCIYGYMWVCTYLYAYVYKYMSMSVYDVFMCTCICTVTSVGD